ncbi:SDR family NAD(P)-dependent oxidoreductase [Sphingosinicella sp.]|uniref:SDR family NAD(P)-dependent oxidoreductase n=1 Tax=Sphingosinicella sp. TaxID=1917971 RepID=UPI0017DF8842|nr:SDR family NAD(P)-dependent oxidoreductase [Sphingosinicella sp.]MBA4759198.1 SDR family oxidoreductase [Sphingosinicella sp.]
MTEPFQLQDRTYIVTGGAQGVGRALVEFGLSCGANVVMVDINQALLDDTAAQLDHPRLMAVTADVAVEADVEAMVESTIARFGDVHGLINNAGIVRAAMAHDMGLATWQKVIDVNLTGAFLCLRAVGSRLIEKAERGDPNPGRIVNISSDAGRRGTIGQINYGAAKSGVLGLTMSAAREWARHGITVNSVCYGVVETPMTDTIRNEKFRDRYLRQIPLGRFSDAAEVAPPTWFFLTDAASYITGQHLSVDGGFHIAA